MTIDDNDYDNNVILMISMITIVIIMVIDFIRFHWRDMIYYFRGFSCHIQQE
jgi:hypothetical protein